MSTPSRRVPWTRTLPDEESKIGRALAGGSIPAVAKAIMAHKQLRDAVILRVLDQLDNDCTKLCQKSTPTSPFCKIPVMELVHFQWSEFINSLQINAPLLLQILSTIASHNDHRNQHKRGDVHFPGICMAAAVILKERSQRMTGIQSLVSLMLFATRADKQVCLSINIIARYPL